MPISLMSGRSKGHFTRKTEGACPFKVHSKHIESTLLIGGKVGGGTSSLHTSMLEGPME